MGNAFAARGRGARGRGRDVPRVCARWDAGPRAGRHLAQVTFVFATHCSSEARSGRWLGCAGVSETLLFLGNWQPRCPAEAARSWGREKEKVVTSPGTTTLLLVVQGCCCLPLVFKKKFPGKPLSETWRFEGTDLGALCQVLFVPGITSPDYCLTTSPSLPQSLSPPPALGCSWLCPLR